MRRRNDVFSGRFEDSACVDEAICISAKVVQFEISVKRVAQSFVCATTTQERLNTSYQEPSMSSSETFTMCYLWCLFALVTLF